MRQADRFGKIFIQAERFGNSSGNLWNFKGVREPCAVMVAGGRKKDLRFVFEPAKRFWMNNAVAIMLEGGSQITLFFRSKPALAVTA